MAFPRRKRKIYSSNREFEVSIFLDNDMSYSLSSVGSTKSEAIQNAKEDFEKMLKQFINNFNRQIQEY